MVGLLKTSELKLLILIENKRFNGTVLFYKIYCSTEFRFAITKMFYYSSLYKNCGV